MEDIKRKFREVLCVENKALLENAALHAVGQYSTVDNVHQQFQFNPKKQPKR